MNEEKLKRFLNCALMMANHHLGDRDILGIAARIVERYIKENNPTIDIDDNFETSLKSQFDEL